MFLSSFVSNQPHLKVLGGMKPYDQGQRIKWSRIIPIDFLAKLFKQSDLELVTCLTGGHTAEEILAASRVG